MKTKILILVMFASLVSTMLVGCNHTISASANNELSIAAKLALGTLKLEGTRNAVTAAEAKELVTLWEGYQSISTSDTTSQMELDALVKQIEATMTSDQLNAIDAMNLNEQSISETLSTLGGTASLNGPVGTPSVSASGQSGSTSGTSGMPSGGSSGLTSSGSGGMPSGGPGGIPPGGSSGMPVSGESSGVGDILNGTNTQGTAIATQSTTISGSVQVNPMLLRAVIQLLETRSQAAG